ncbi:hypothetical protein AWC38_SpisGene10832 [Stylophora pistillata]|uniref:Uncharacterized protein n=1 Tax=Stylophora pistillata TaxID=50429 RepID=A0A2B4S681_STYPI|nr:hypothetical protein AWC38_SpisGene10832 [Stylophora pistillata]
MHYEVDHPTCHAPGNVETVDFTEVPEGIVLESFMKYLSPVEEELVTNFLGKAEFADENNDLFDFPERFNCRSQVSPENIKKVLVEIANQELIQKPHVMVATWQPIVKELKQYPQFRTIIMNEIMREQSQDANIGPEAVVLEENQITPCESCRVMKAELTQLKAKVTRFKNKLSSNQEQWVQTFKGSQEQNRLFMVNTAVQTEPVVETEDTSPTKSMDQPTEQDEDFDEDTTDVNSTTWHHDDDPTWDPE